MSKVRIKTNGVHIHTHIDTYIFFWTNKNFHSLFSYVFIFWIKENEKCLYEKFYSKFMRKFYNMKTSQMFRKLIRYVSKIWIIYFFWKMVQVHFPKNKKLCVFSVRLCITHKKNHGQFFFFKNQLIPLLKKILHIFIYSLKMKTYKCFKFSSPIQKMKNFPIHIHMFVQMLFRLFFYLFEKFFVVLKRTVWVFVFL